MFEAGKDDDEEKEHETNETNETHTHTHTHTRTHTHTHTHYEAPRKQGLQAPRTGHPGCALADLERSVLVAEHL